MKRVIWVLVLLGVVWQGISFAETIEVNSQISEITVFPDQAAVVRKAALKLPKGAHLLRFSSLPGVIESNSITAKGTGQQRVKLFGAELVTTQLEVPQDVRVREITERLKDLQRKEASLNHTKEILSSEREFLKSIQAASSQQIGKDLITQQPSVEQVSSLYVFLDKEFLANFTRLQEADKGLEEVHQEMDRLNRELGQLNTSRWKSQTAIQVEVESEETGEFEVEVSYRIPGASWSPSYEARVDSNSKKVGFGIFGVLRQNTGEDWENVKLTLSTARPSASGRMPELQTWYLRKFEVRTLNEKLALAKKNGRSGVAEGFFSASETPVSNSQEASKLEQDLPHTPAQLATAQLQTQGTAMTYVLPKQVSIPSDGQAHQLPITMDTFTADFAYETTPKLIQQAFLRAKIQNTTEALFLAGAVNVFLDGAFVATSSIKQIAPQEEFDLYLGVDDRIKVTQRRLKDKVDVSIFSGIQGKSKTIDRIYLTTIENYTSAKAKVILIDHFPVSEHDEIKIQDLIMDPKPSEEDKEKPGLGRWIFELEPRQKQQVSVSFRIRHPADFAVEGL